MSGLHNTQNFAKLLIKTFRPEFFYFLVLGSADPNFWKTRIKIKLGSNSIIFILSADRLMPSTNKIKARTIFEGNQVRLH